MKKHTKEEFIKKANIKHKNKYDYSKIQYNKNTDILTIICPEHGEFEQIAFVHLAGCGCQICGKNNSKMKKNKNTEWFIEEAKKIHGNFFDYSKSDYTKSKNKIIIICPIHGEISITPDKHLRNGGCKKCKLRSAPEDFVNKAKQLHGNNFDYSETQYVTSRIKVTINCRKHGKFTTKPSNHLDKKRKGGCKKCWLENRSGKNSHWWDKDREKIKYNKKFGKKCRDMILRCLKKTNQSKTNKTTDLLGYNCEDLILHVTSHENWKNLNKNKWHLDHVFPIQAFLDYGIYDLKIINSLDNLQPLTEEENINKSDNYNKEAFETWLKTKISSPEEELKNLLNWTNQFGNFELNIAGHLIDNKKKIVIIYCNLLENSKLEKNHNYLKHKYYEDYKCITIFEDEWRNKNFQCKNVLKFKLGGCSRKIYARKCDVVKLSKEEFNKFCNKYHIQGSNKLGKFFFGLTYLQELVMTLSFGRHHRNNTLTLDRFCCKGDIQVIGGASKLLAQCIKSAKKEGYQEVITWSDNRWSSGNVYRAMGFTLKNEIKPDYYYLDNKSPYIRKNKQSQKKSNTNCPLDKTEREWAEINGLSRIWDCGKKSWIMEWN